VTSSWRIANQVDIIPKLPPAQWGFVHVNQLFSVNSFGTANILPSCTHALNAYLYLLDQLNGGGTVTLNPACARL
jgi:hypothetical protein